MDIKRRKLLLRYIAIKNQKPIDYYLEVEPTTLWLTQDEIKEFLVRSNTNWKIL